MEYLVLIAVIIAVVVVRVFLTKSDKTTAQELSKQFNAWLLSTDATRPSNDTFRQLYRRATGKSQALTPVIRDVGLMYQTTEADVLDNFPTKAKQLVPAQLGIMDNLTDFYDARWNENFILTFWIRFVVFWPQRLVSYLGFKEDGTTAKLSNVLGWLVEAIFLLYKPLLKKLL